MSGTLEQLQRTLVAIGGKWKPVILFLLMESPRRAGELARSIPEVNGKMLTQQLRALEKDGLIVRTVFREVPPRVEYAITKAGERLRPVLEAMITCGAGHPRQTSAPVIGEKVVAATPRTERPPEAPSAPPVVLELDRGYID